MSNKTIYTIGYSAFLIDDFIKVLKNNKITCVIDVRSNPYSKYFTDYNRNELELRLKKENLLYRLYDKSFGAQQGDKAYYRDGYLDFEKFRKSKAFAQGVAKVAKGMDVGYRFAFMCAEKDPINCHRNIMVAKHFHDIGYDLKNILADHSLESQSSIEERLVDTYYPNKDQISIFGDENISIDEMVENSYKKRNKEIGFKEEEEL